MSLEWFVYLLYITTLYVLFIVGKERFETQDIKTSSIALNGLLLLSFLLTVITGFILLCAHSGISIPSSVVYAVLFIIFGALIMTIMAKEKTFDAKLSNICKCVASSFFAWSMVDRQIP